MGQLGAHSFERSRVLPIYFMGAGDRQENSSLKKPLLPKWAPESRAVATIHVVSLVTVDSKVQMSPHGYSFPRHVIRCGKADSCAPRNVGGQEPEDTQLHCLHFFVLSSSYLSFLPSAHKPDLSQLSHYPKNINFKAYIQKN